MSRSDVVGTDDPQRQDEKRKDADVKQVQAYADITAVLGTPEGRRSMYRILTELGAGVIAAGPLAYPGEGPLDVSSTLLNVGGMLKAEELKLAWLIACPAEYTQMMTDAAFEVHKEHEESVRKRKKLERRHSVDDVNPSVVDEPEEGE